MPPRFYGGNFERMWRAGRVLSVIGLIIIKPTNSLLFFYIFGYEKGCGLIYSSNFFSFSAGWGSASVGSSRRRARRERLRSPQASRVRSTVNGRFSCTSEVSCAVSARAARIASLSANTTHTLAHNGGSPIPFHKREVKHYSHLHICVTFSPMRRMRIGCVGKKGDIVFEGNILGLKRKFQLNSAEVF